jgi:exopolyphosphatase / guanosine-5'-triphosphate,3'-diphosphate pyrophosphatase
MRRLLRRRAPTDTPSRISGVRVGIVDVGANTVRLLVAGLEEGELLSLGEERVQLGLGEEIERSGRIGPKKLACAAEAVAAQVRRARKLGASAVDVLVTSPGRQAANGRELVSEIATATQVPTRVLTPVEESELAWRGAVSATRDRRGLVAVCDVGGGSSQIAVGTSSGELEWAQSIDLGSLRLTRRAFGSDPPDVADVARATNIVAAAFADVEPPYPDWAIAVGGTARALRKVVGPTLDEETLLLAVRRLSKRSSKKIAKDYGVVEARARTMTAGALILIAVQRRLDAALEVGRRGLREGAALSLLAEAAAAARSA